MEEKRKGRVDAGRDGNRRGKREKGGRKGECAPGRKGGRRWGGDGGVEKEEGGRRRERRKGKDGGKGTGSLCWWELKEYVRSHQVVQERALLSKLDNLFRGWILLSTSLPFAFLGVTGGLVELVIK